jgi:hypothetical protein
MNIKYIFQNTPLHGWQPLVKIENFHIKADEIIKNSTAGGK